MIPKILHYIWVGRNPLPDNITEYIASWKKYCPDYQIIEWNEDNFDIISSPFASEAYHAKKWAFVSDYIRLAVLYEYGGIYLDTDMEILKNIDFLLENKAFSGFESNEYISAGIIGCEKGNPWIKSILDDYTNRKFLQDDGTYNQTTTPQTITKITKQLSPDLKLNGTYQELSCGVTIYPSDYFYPLDTWTFLMKTTTNTVINHHFMASWNPELMHSFNKKREFWIKHPHIYSISKSNYMFQQIIKYGFILFSTYDKYGLKGGIYKVIQHLKKKVIQS